MISRAIQESDGLLRAGAQKHRQGDHAHQHRTQVSEEKSVGHQRCSKVIILRQLRQQRRARHFVKRDEDANDDRCDQQVPK